MNDYSPCPSCRRHARDAHCPFCGAQVHRREPIATLGTMSRAMVFASATLAAAACGGSKKPATTPSEESGAEVNEREVRHRPPCTQPDPDEVAAAQKKVDEAKTENEKRGAENELARVSQPVCAPYGAPPARRRIV